MWWFLVLAAASQAEAFWVRGSKTIQISVDTSSGVYNCSMSTIEDTMEVWLQSEEDTPRVYCGGAWHSPSNGLRLEQVSPGDAELNITWSLEGPEVCKGKTMVTGFLYRAESDTLHFRQEYPLGLPDTSGLPQPTAAGQNTQFNSSTATITEFPAFSNAHGTKLNELGYITWAGTFGYTRAMHSTGLAGYLGGAEGGPIVLHEHGIASRTAAVISPSREFFGTFLATRAKSYPNCTIVHGVDFNHYDCPGGIMHNVPSQATCESLCRYDAVCSVFSYDPASQTCYRKYSQNGRMKSAHTSGVCPKDNVLVGGIQGFVHSVPVGFSTEILISANNHDGISAALSKWGRVLQNSYNTSRAKLGVVSTKLGFWTDNGAYWYGPHAPNTSVLNATVAALRAQHVPVKYVQLDPWVWSPCVFEPRPNLLPTGLEGLREAIDLPLLIYTFFWCVNKTSAVYDLPFVNSIHFQKKGRDMQVALPSGDAAAEFYSRIFSTVKNVTAGFEVDFLSYANLGFPDFTHQISGNERWLQGLHDAVLSQGKTLQLCMGLPSYFLHSLLLPAVTNARASGDDFPINQHRWLIGYTAALMGPLDLLPFMDNVWTNPVQPGNPYNVTVRPNVLLMVAVSALTSGPVGLGDGTGLTNSTVAMSLCTGDGTLLHPEVAAVPIDKMYDKPSVSTVYDGELGGPEVWVGSTTMPSSEHADTWWSVLVVNGSEGYELERTDLFPSADASRKLLVVESGRCVHDQPLSSCAKTFLKSITLYTPPETPHHGHGFNVFTIVPNCGDLYFLGELDKVATVSPARFSSYTCSETKLCVTMNGLETPATETIRLGFGRQGRVVVASLTLTSESLTHCISSTA